MSESKTAGAAAASTETTVSAPAASPQTAGLLDRIISATKQTAPDHARNLVNTLVKLAESKTVKYDRNLPTTIKRAIDEIDRLVSSQLNAIMHDPAFLKLEGSWRGLHTLVKSGQSVPNLRVRMMQARKSELTRDLTRAVEFDQSHLWKSVYDAGFGTTGGEAFSALIGDYDWSYGEQDVQTLQLISGVAGACFAPFITAPAPGMFGLNNWTEINKPRDLARVFETSEYTKWRAFRKTDDARYVVMTMPRTLARMPYGRDTNAVREFGYEEAPRHEDGRPAQLEHDHYCWSNSAYSLGTRLIAAFGEYGFCTSIRGPENGGKVENLPLHSFVTDSGDFDVKCPTEVNIPSRRDGELGRLGFMPLVHHKGSDYAVFFEGQTLREPTLMVNEDDTANQRISTRLPYVLATGRIAHCLKVLAREKIGSGMEADDCERWLNQWITQYVSAPPASEETRRKFPLREARVEVVEVPGNPGVYDAVAYLRPWLQMEELNASLRMVARIPKSK